MEKYSLTETGKSKAESSSGEGGLRYAIISYIESHGNDATLNELADATNVNSIDIRKKVNQLIAEKWVAKSEDMDNDWDF